MLTGDKVETATSIAISAGLKHRRHQLHFMREIVEKKDIEMHIKEISPKIGGTVLIIDGKTLDTILTHSGSLE
jgi:magnesium-transporting ATPase (P-type)